MCFGNNNSCLWYIILILLILGVGGNGCGSSCGNNCGCNNCGCGGPVPSYGCGCDNNCGCN